MNNDDFSHPAQVNSYPKLALSWYCVGCYYWCCLKHEFAQKYILKTTKMDKKFAKAWVMLGHVLAAQVSFPCSIL